MPVETQSKQPEQPLPPPAQREQQQHHPLGSRSEGEGPTDDISDDDMDEDGSVVEAGSPPTGYERVFKMVEKFAATRMGQNVIERADRALRTVEDTAKWSLPEDKTSETQLERPMAWLPFLYLIVMLRIVRTTLSVAALMIGNGPVTPHDVVYFIQTRRRKLRAIRMQGAKAIQERETAATASKSNSSDASGNSSSIGGKLRTIFSSAICRPGMHREPMRRFCVTTHDTETTSTNSEKEASSSVTPTAARSTAKRPRDEDECLEEDVNLTIDQMLTKYANADSEDDSDFVPNAHDTTNEDDESESSYASSVAGSGDEAEVQNNAPVKMFESQTTREENEGPHESDASSTTNGTNVSANISNNHNQSVELADHSTSASEMQLPKKAPVMPKPIIEIKKEYSTSEEQLVFESSPKENGGDTWQPDLVSDNQSTNIMQDDGNEHDEDETAAAMTKPKSMKIASNNVTATAVQTKETPSPQLRVSNESEPFRKNRKVMRSLKPSTSSSSSSSSSLSSLSSNSVKTRLIPHFVSRKRSRSFNTHSQIYTSKSSESIDSRSDIDFFQSLDDVNAVSMSDNLNKFETTRLSAILIDNACIALPLRNTNAPEQRLYNSSASSSTEDEFYSPVGSPQDVSLKDSNSWPETPRTDAQASTEHRVYGQNKHTHHQNQQYHHQNRFRNRNKR